MFNNYLRQAPVKKLVLLTGRKQYNVLKVYESQVGLGWVVAYPSTPVLLLRDGRTHLAGVGWIPIQGWSKTDLEVWHKLNRIILKEDNNVGS